MKKLKSNIGWLIDKSNYTREDIRKRYGKSANTISNWCTGKSFPSHPETWDLAELLGVKVDELYERTIEERE
ncbi:DNA-binding protein [Heyndrickxia shackletonii]|uniref:DNA-binding protein n=1 Tax=Heyndrickxia shackletonii TaxID=157838 RepID=A0A0Q3WZA9_9BACI|nr:helix-turn-helix transcriptional regulator [Heyndrickxia shackletonii]KQL54495.1 DNA-binding protein [Heyndrickxia shackletonii]NEY99222.1 helix-turn-helix transcriptional regulator [Heyndrickxia shackletonii]